ncbi:MAG: hypothetical protein QME52_03100 [Bacteroidota bacterium]|nr:hypothetical protein [Bacteroidota bacterium]
MFEQETTDIIKAILSRIPQTSGGSIGIKDILAADIPHPIKTFFRSDVEAMLLSELQHHHKGSRFSFDHPEIQSLQQQINSILVLHYKLKWKEYNQRVDDAVHMIINYLIRPQWALTNAIFEKEQSISSHSLISLLRYFGPYEYLREIITHYLSEKKIASIKKDEFKSLVWKVDGEFIRRKSGDELAKMMSPIFDFFDYPNKTSNNSIMIKALIKFFEDKGLTMVLPRFEGEIVQGKTEMNRHELSELLEDVRRTLGAFQVEKIEFEQTELIEKSHNINSDTAPRDGTLKLDLLSSISESDKRKFIKKIFKQNEDAYTSALKSMAELLTWKQASKSIDEIFIQYDVDPYSSEATRFIEVLFEQYHPKSR